MGEMSAKCVKWLMFGFNLIFWISGIALIIAGAVAQSNYKEYARFINGLTITAPVLLIVVGVFISIVAFLGCWGAARDNYGMLIGFAIIVSIIFVIQFAGGIAGYVQKGKIAESTNKVFPDYMHKYHNDNNSKEIVDNLQHDLECCGTYSYSDWFNATEPVSTVPPVTPTTVNITGNGTANSTSSEQQIRPSPVSTDEGIVVGSCCKEGIDKCPASARTKEAVDAAKCGSNGPSCKIFTTGCERRIEQVVEVAIAGVAGAAIGLAFIQLIGIIFACYLARRIRSGYVYA